MDQLFIYENITQCVTMAGVAKKQGRKPTEADLGVIENASAVVDTDENEIVWLGPAAEVPKEYDAVVNRTSCDETVWLPELVECHTHLVHAGSRHRDFALRCGGMSYQQIAEGGGGILRTLAFTRDASLEELLQTAEADLDRFQKYGVGVLEMKSGYGLSLESELKILKAISLLQQATSMVLVPTFLPAHATPPEFRGRTQEYVDVICKEWIPEVAKQKLATFFDVFIENGFFSLAQGRQLCEVAKEHGFKLKIHADQFTDLGGAGLGVELGAVSCDHLDNVSAKGIAQLASSETVAVLCPGASLFTGTPYPPARALIDAGARVALSTDFNPGTCPSRNLPLMTTLACTQMKLSIPEALAGVTYNAAAALGLQDKFGSLEKGKQFRVCQLKTDTYESLPYCFGELE